MSALRPCIDAIADVAASIAAVELPREHGFIAWRPWATQDPRPPEWGDEPLWAEAIAAFSGRRPPTPDKPVLLHRDLHPLNLLWSADDPGRPSVVDWVNTCVGHPHAELPHTRFNLAIGIDMDAADRFLRRYLSYQRVPSDYDRWWDLAAAVGLLPGPIDLRGAHSVGRTDITEQIVAERVEGFVRNALRAS